MCGRDVHLLQLVQFAIDEYKWSCGLVPPYPGLVEVARNKDLSEKLWFDEGHCRWWWRSRAFFSSMDALSKSTFSNIRSCGIGNSGCWFGWIFYQVSVAQLFAGVGWSFWSMGVDVDGVGAHGHCFLSRRCFRMPRFQSLRVWWWWDASTLVLWLL